MPKYKSNDYFGYKEATDILTEALLKRAVDIIALPAKGGYAINYIIDGVATRQPIIEREQVMFLLVMRLLSLMAPTQEAETRILTLVVD